MNCDCFELTSQRRKGFLFESPAKKTRLKHGVRIAHGDEEFVGLGLTSAAFDGNKSKGLFPRMTT
jgi:hypothetical protein